MVMLGIPTGTKTRFNIYKLKSHSWKVRVPICRKSLKNKENTKTKELGTRTEIDSSKKASYTKEPEEWKEDAPYSNQSKSHRNTHQKDKSIVMKDQLQSHSGKRGQVQ